ncbi:MAG: hypothetical protein J6Q94_09010 [Clostridia bacterium]|nr:hypothetical protein [Clostridia bacterium]
MDDILKKNGYLYSADTSKLVCEYYSCLRTGQPEFRGEYMTQYSRADEICGFLLRISNKCYKARFPRSFFIKGNTESGSG